MRVDTVQYEEIHSKYLNDLLDEIEYELPEFEFDLIDTKPDGVVYQARSIVKGLGMVVITVSGKQIVEINSSVYRISYKIELDETLTIDYDELNYDEDVYTEVIGSGKMFITNGEEIDDRGMRNLDFDIQELKDKMWRK